MIHQLRIYEIFEWDDIKQATRDRGGLVGEIADRIVVATDYSLSFA
jgi:hypothetical protein